jgi:hypothetical protein
LKLNYTFQLLVGADDVIYWEEAYILYKKKLTENLSQGMLAIIQCRIVCLPVCYLKI